MSENGEIDILAIFLKIMYRIKNKLSRSSLSVVEHEATREALDRRAKLLNGWIHLLRWIKTN